MSEDLKAIEKQWASEDRFLAKGKKARKKEQGVQSTTVPSAFGTTTRSSRKRERQPFPSDKFASSNRKKETTSQNLSFLPTNSHEADQQQLSSDSNNREETEGESKDDDVRNRSPQDNFGTTSLPNENNQQDLHLIEATLVANSHRDGDDVEQQSSGFQNIPQAEIVKQEEIGDNNGAGSGQKNRCLYAWIALLVAAVAISITVTAIICGTGNCAAGNNGNADLNQSDTISSNNNINGSFPVSTSSSSPSATPVPLSLIQLPNYTINKIQEDPSSPQAKAYEWMLTQVPATYAYSIEDWRKQQLFALAAIYFSLDGDSWSEFDRAFWLDSSISECDWTPEPQPVSTFYLQNNEEIYQLECSGYSSQEQITSLQLSFFSNPALNGVLPPETELLSALQTITLQNSNWQGILEEVLPYSLTNLQQLEYLSVYNNNLIGTIPSFLGKLNQLLYLSLSACNLSGSIPSEVGLLTDLTTLSLWGNQLQGEIPSSLGRLTKLTTLSLHGNDQLSGTVPQEVCRLTQYFELSPISVDCQAVMCPANCDCDCL